LYAWDAEEPKGSGRKSEESQGEDFVGSEVKIMQRSIPFQQKLGGRGKD
jgi:hypothetical protein